MDRRFQRTSERIRAEAERRLQAWQARDEAARSVQASGGRLESVEEHGAGASRYLYDERGELQAIIEPDGRRTSYGYDDLRRLVRVEHPDGAVTSYAYDARDRLTAVEERGVSRGFEYDEAGRLKDARRGNADPFLFRYDGADRVTEVSTPLVSTFHAYDEAGRVACIRQVIDGVALEVTLAYDGEGRLAALGLPGAHEVRYRWSASNRLQSLSLGEREVARFEVEPARLRARTRLGNGVVEETEADPVDGRPRTRTVRNAGGTLFRREYAYGAAGELLDDGARRYAYDGQGRLASAEERGGETHRFEYDALDNLVRVESPGSERRFGHVGDRLVSLEGPGVRAEVLSDKFGRVVGLTGAEGWTYRYDDAGQLIQVLRHGAQVARFLYDHKGRLVLARYADRIERYLYGPDDALVAVTDAAGQWLRLPLCSPYGVVAELRAGVGLVFLHHDPRGACHLTTDEAGQVTTRFAYSPFGAPQVEGTCQPVFGSRAFVPEVGLYWFGARWYHPGLGRFLTPDSYTAAPDDERLIHPCVPGVRQASARAAMLGDWLRRPRLRNRYAFCGNDPVNHLDPDGHWSFGGVLLTLLGIVWTLPNTVIGLLIEISNLVGEIIRWLVYAFTAGRVTWSTLGFDVAGSSRLNAFALVFKFGWFGELLNKIQTYAITFGNSIFVSPMGEKLRDPKNTRLVRPKAYKGTVELQFKDTLYEHELRHTNQYGWFGPFFLGFYLVDAVFIHDYWTSWTETDARDHSFDELDKANEFVPTDVAVSVNTLAPEVGATPQPLKKAWVYWYDGTHFTSLRTDDTGALFAVDSGKDASKPDSYTTPFKAREQANISLFASTCAKRLPDAVLRNNLALFDRQVVPWADPIEQPSGASVVIQLDEVRLSLTKPEPLSLWPVLWEPLPEGYVTDGLLQKDKLWKLQQSKYKLQVSEDSTAVAASNAVRPRERALVVEGLVDQRVTGVSISLLDAQGNFIGVKAGRDAVPLGLPQIAATLGAPSGPTRPFSAVVYLADAAQAFGPIFIAVQAGPMPRLLEFFFCQLTGVQIALVDDYGASPDGQTPGRMLGEADEVVVVDFESSPSTVSADDQRKVTRARRMVPYDHHFRNRPIVLSSGTSVVPRPEMPLWMMELQLVGTTKADLESLMALRKALLPSNPTALDFEINWSFKLEWNGPDRGMTDDPMRHFREDVTLPVGTQRASLKLLKDDKVEDTKLAEPVAYPVDNRRPPKIAVQGRTRRWGRGSTGAERDTVVIEYQPVLFAAEEKIRGGDGRLSANALSIAGKPVEPGLVIDAASGKPAAPPPGTPIQALPVFRVRGANPPNLDALVDALVAEFVHDNSTEDYVRLLPLAIWQVTMRSVAGHESGHRQFQDGSSFVERFAKTDGTTYWYGLDKNMPLFGPPHGYGYGQLDSPEDDVKQDTNWDVVENLRESIRILMDGAAHAYERLQAHLPASVQNDPTTADRRTRAVYQRDTVRRYNSGPSVHEFTWSGTDWVINPNMPKWANANDHSQGPYGNLAYPNQVLGTHVAYWQGSGANATFPWPITFTAADYGPGI